MLSLFRHTFRFFLLTLFVLLIALAILTGLLRVGLPYMSSYKSEIQGWVSNYLKTPVDIGSMEFAWNGARPSLKLDKVALIRDGKQKVDVKLDQIQLDLNLVKSLLTADLHINEVTLSGADLSVEYDGGEFRVSGDSGAGSKVDSDQPRSGLDIVAWLMNAKRVGLTNSRIKLVDTERGIDYQITDLNVSAENSGKFHQLRVELDLPEQLGQTFEVGIDLTGDSDALSESVGSFYINSASMNLEDWFRIWPERQFDIRGTSEVEAWGRWSGGRLQSLRATIDGQDLTLENQLAEAESANSSLDNQPTLSSFESDVYWSREPGGWVASIDKLELNADDIVNRVDSMILRQRKESNSGEREYELVAEGKELHLAVLVPVIEALGSVKTLSSVSELIAGIDPSGTVYDWSFDSEINPDGPSLSVSGRLDGVSTKSYKGIPGVSGVSGEIDVTDGIGKAVLKTRDFSLVSPEVFPKGLSIAEVDASFSINLNDRLELIRSEKIFLKDEGVLVFGQLELSLLADNEIYVNLKSAFSVDDVTLASRYLPTGIMGDGLTSWLTTSVQGGRVEKGELLMIGKLRDFPYRDKRGVFKVDVDIKDGELRFLPDWPSARSVTGNLYFDGPGMRMDVSSGYLADVSVSGVTGAIEDFKSPTLTLDGSGVGDLPKMLVFANEGPLSDILSPALDQTTGSGRARLELALSVPLQSPASRTKGEVLTVDGKVVLDGNPVSFNRFDLDLERVRGSVAFDETGVRIRNLKGRYHGSEVSVTADTLGSARDRRTRIKVGGLIRPDRVLAGYDIPVSGFFEGASRWDVEAIIPYNAPEGEPVATLRATSKLQGTAILFPAPLNKSNNGTRQVAVNGSFDKAGNQIWRVTYQGFKTMLVAEPDEGMKSLAIRVGNGALPRVTDGIRIEGDADEIALDGWTEAISQIIENLPETSGDPELLMPVTGRLSTPSMLVGTTSLGPSKFYVNSDNDYLNGVIENAHLRGNVRQPRIHWETTSEVKARIAYVDSEFIDALKSQGQEGETSEPLDPRKFPPMEVHVAEFIMNSLMLKDVVLRTEPDAAGLKITALGFANNNGQLSGEGFWHLADPQSVNPELADQHRTRLDLSLQSDDVGRTLAGIGFDGSMAEGRGAVNARLRWQGPAYSIDPAKIIGSLEMDLKDGRFLKVDPGAARLVGLFAFQELPRRLSLDFRDLVNDGLDYHTIKGNLDVAGGVARIGFLQLEGPIGVIEVAGYTHLLDQTFDQNIKVLPRLSAAVPLLALLSGGATAGIGALVATPVLKALGIDFDRLGLSEYKLQGSWDAPELLAIKVPIQQPLDD